MSSVFDALFSPAQAALYDTFGVEATHYTDGSDEGTSCTVLVEEQGEMETDYGQTATAHIVVQSDEVSDPRRGDRIVIDARTWRIDHRLGASEGTAEGEIAVFCVDDSYYGVS